MRWQSVCGLLDCGGVDPSKARTCTISVTDWVMKLHQCSVSCCFVKMNRREFPNSWNYGTFSVETWHQQVCALGRIQKCVVFVCFFSRGVVSVQYWGLRIVSLCFARDVFQLASLDCDLECTLGCFAAECEAAGMRVSASKSEALALCSGLLPVE